MTQINKVETASEESAQAILTNPGAYSLAVRCAAYEWAKTNGHRRLAGELQETLHTGRL